MKVEVIKKVLEKIQNPVTKKNLVESNSVENISTDNNSIHLTIAISNPAMHAKKRLDDAIRFHLGKHFGENITINIEYIKRTEEGKKERKLLREVKQVICIASGKGGVGKSTVTMNIAGALTKSGYKVGIIDADIYGPSIPTMTDTADLKPSMVEVDGVKMIQPLDAQGLKIMSIGYFTDATNAVVWRGPMASKALNQLFTDVHWGALDFLLVDLPPGTGDIHLSLVQNVPIDGVVIVSTPQEVALADARRGIKMFQLDSINVPILGLIENMAWFTPEELPENKYYIFGRDGVKNLAEGLNLPFLGSIPLLQGLRESCDVGNVSSLHNEHTGKYFDEITANLLNGLSLIKK